jgi:arylsulfatase A
MGATSVKEGSIVSPGGLSLNGSLIPLSTSSELALKLIRMRVSWFLVGMIAFALGQGCQSAERPASGSPPNILLILADDLGYGDLGCYAPQSLVPTPHLDQLAAEGMRFTRAYCPVSVCSPTRYALMTGEYPWRSWKKTGVMANYEPSMIDSTLLTLPEMLQQAGYQTVGLGKWHLGSTFATLDGQKPVGYGKFRADENGANLDLTQPVTDGPLDHGFDHFWGFSCASECWIMNDRKITAALDHDFYTIEATPGHERLERISLPEYLPRITGRTLEFLRSRTGSSPPFFLYFSPYVPHVPWP